MKCPHSKKSLFAHNVLLRQHRLTPKVCEQIDEIGESILTILAEGSAWEDIVQSLRNASELDLSHMIQWFTAFMQTQSNHFPDITKQFKRYLKIRSNGDANTMGHLHALSAFALVDVYTAALLHSQHQVSKAKIIWLLKLSLRAWDADLYKSFSGIVYNHIIHETWEKVDTKALIEKLKQLLPQSVEEHSYGEPSCPFYLSDKKDVWIEQVFQFFIQEVIPKMQEAFKHRNQSRERFYSGNY